MGYVSSLEGNWGIIPESMQTLLNLYIGILQEEMEEIKPLSRHQDWDAHSLPVIPDPFGDSKISNLVQPAKIPSWQGGYASPQINEVIKKRWPFYPRSLEIIGCHWCHFWKESRFTIQIRSQRTVRIFLVWSFFLPIRSVWQMSWLFLELDGNISFEFEWLVPLSWFQIFTWKFHEIDGKQLYTSIQYYRYIS